jgi:hypothetical protein
MKGAPCTAWFGDQFVKSVNDIPVDVLHFHVEIFYTGKVELR